MNRSKLIKIVALMIFASTTVSAHAAPKSHIAKPSKAAIAKAQKKRDAALNNDDFEAFVRLLNNAFARTPAQIEEMKSGLLGKEKTRLQQYGLSPVRIEQRLDLYSQELDISLSHAVNRFDDSLAWAQEAANLYSDNPDFMTKLGGYAFLGYHGKAANAQVFYSRDSELNIEDFGVTALVTDVKPKKVAVSVTHSDGSPVIRCTMVVTQSERDLIGKYWVYNASISDESQTLGACDRPLPIMLSTTDRFSLELDGKPVTSGEIIKSTSFNLDAK